MSPAFSADPFTSESGDPAEIQKRGASNAAWAVNPRNMFNKTWTCPWGCYISSSIAKVDALIVRFEKAYLHVTPHHPIGKEQFLSAEGHRRDNCMIRTFTPLQDRPRID